jgi:hypothetical protein
VPKFVLIAQPNDASVNPLIAATNSQRMLNVRVSTPVNGIAITSATR